MNQILLSRSLFTDSEKGTPWVARTKIEGTGANKKAEQSVGLLLNL